MGNLKHSDLNGNSAMIFISDSEKKTQNRFASKSESSRGKNVEREFKADLRLILQFYRTIESDEKFLHI